MKAKAQVRLRSRKMKGGGQSLYLDIYDRGIRRYEYLHLYLIDERTPTDRNLNSETMRVAEAIRARRMIEVQREGAGMAMPSDRTVASLLGEWVESRRGRSRGTVEVWSYWAGIVSKWKGAGVALKDISKAWWTMYKDWVAGLKLNATTKHHYIVRMRCVLNRAEKDGLLVVNPSRGDRIERVKRAERVWLTAEELTRLKATHLDNPELERAFLFGCLTGLRWSDILPLRYEDIEGRRLTKKIVKTGKVEYMTLNSQAVELIGTGAGRVFPSLDRRDRLTKYLQRWAMAAGVNKAITFHSSRHTFAVLMLSAGVDIYTLSRLLGHSSVTTTQIYADIVDARRIEAVEKLPQI